jgi:hypothetical protein|tara:strand:+ start:1883 stop:2236 length:354 start_codon:yes stop_codon:yes gene_type:complete
MNQNEFDELIDSLVESVTLNYDLDAFDYYDAIIEVCENCNYYFEYYKAWTLVNFVRFDMYDNGAKIQLFDEVELEVKELCRYDETTSLNDIILHYAFYILKTATLKKYNEQVKEEVA